jgi:ribosomal protein L37E
VFAVCEGADVAHALSSAREHLSQLKLALTASVELGAAAAAATTGNNNERCRACGWLMRFDAVQPGFESIIPIHNSQMAIDDDNNNGNGGDASHAVCRRCGGGSASTIMTAISTSSTLNQDNNHFV